MAWRALEVLMNEAMRAERTEFLGAQPHQRTESRRGYANGFKPKNSRRRARPGNPAGAQYG